VQRMPHPLHKMDDNQRTPDLKSDLNGEQQQSKSLVISPIVWDTEDNNNALIRKPVQPNIIEIKSDNMNMEANCVLNAKGNKMVLIAHPSGTISFSRGRIPKQRGNIICILRNGYCYITYRTNNSAGESVLIEIFDTETKLKVGPFQGDNGGTGIVKIKNKVAKPICWKWPKGCKRGRSYFIKASLMNEKEEEIECCHVQSFHIVPHTDESLHTKDPIYQKATKIVSELSKHQIQYYPNTPLNDSILLAICLVVLGVSDLDPKLEEHLRSVFGFEDFGFLQANISLIEGWCASPLSQPSKKEIQMLETYLKQIRILLPKLKDFLKQSSKSS